MTTNGLAWALRKDGRIDPSKGLYAHRESAEAAARRMTGHHTYDAVAVAELAVATTDPGDLMLCTTKCFECGHELSGPVCPACNPAPKDYQDRVHTWVQECFGRYATYDRIERADRLLEEVLELLQSGGYDLTRVAALTQYVDERPPGTPSQETGGVMVTLAAYCNAFGLDLNECGEVELARVTQPEMVLKIRAKQATKAEQIPFSPLPQPVPATVKECPSPEQAAKLICDFMGWPEDGPARDDANKLARQIHEPAYRAGWNDREGDLIAGVERITGRALSQPAEQLASNPGALTQGVEEAVAWREAVHAWVREDLPTGAKLNIGFYAPKLIDRLLAAAPAQPAPALGREEVQDLISDAISDSIDMDWSASIGARYVVEALIKEGIIKC